MAATCLYTSVSCNSASHCVDWGENNLICFGASYAVVIYDPEFNNCAGKVIHTLVKHKGLVNSVKWFRTELGFELVSGSVDKTIIIWQEDKTNNCYFAKDVLSDHQGSVRVVKPFQIPGRNETWIASASVDNTLRLWHRDSGQESFLCNQIISFGHGFALDVAWSQLPSSTDLLLVIARDDSKVYLYSKLEKSEQFEQKLVLVGHEDWVPGLDIVEDESGNLLLSSCSQDSFIRLWKISRLEENKPDHEDNLITLKDNRFTTCCGGEFSVTLESVLAGHDNWVMSVQWQPKGAKNKVPQLLSSSTDKTLILWEHDKEMGLWQEKVRVGEVGGNTLGFYDAVFSPDGSSVLAIGHQGAFHLWKHKLENDSWVSSVALHGHSKEVSDLCWDPQGSFLLSCSMDQTTRLHAVWQRESTLSDSEKETWHEVARPQIHGYDLWALAPIHSGLFASAGEEKIIRVFACTKNFIENFRNITKLQSNKLIQDTQPELPEGASVPSLGLSNKAVFSADLNNEDDVEDEERHPKDQYPEHYFKSITLSEPPTEDLLLQNTLWPEVQKLYGHGYEVFALAANHAGTLLASACKASKAEHAGVILWEVNRWQQVGHLMHHTLTVTQLAFSPDDAFLLSVSRDRTWALYRLQGEKGYLYERVASTEKSKSLHTRIIWACAWSHDNRFFATASRDKKVVIWSVSAIGEVSPASVVLETQDSATALDFAPSLTPDDRYLLGVGLDNGHVFLYTWSPKQGLASSDWKQILHLDERHAHHLCVKRVRFCPKTSSTGKAILSTCGDDHFVKIFNIDMTD